MGRLQTWGAAARRSRLFQVGAVVVVLALLAGSIVLVTRSAGRRLPHRPPWSVPSRSGTRSPTGTGWPIPT